MKFKITSIPSFDKKFKKLTKKYPSLKEDFSKIIEILYSNSEYGIPLGNNCFKIRISISSKGKGKSGGARIVTHLLLTEGEIVMLTIFNKSELNSISNKELKDLIKKINR